MKTDLNLTVVASDKLIILDERSLYLNELPTADFHALQWSGNSGVLEYGDGRNLLLKGAGDYEKYAADFVAAFKDCAAKIDSRPDEFHLWSEKTLAWVFDENLFKNHQRNEIQASLATLDLASLRPLRALAKKTATEEDIEKLSEIETEAASLRKRLEALND
ncbi:MAG: hypothetical protein ACRCTY_04080 [Candidatus Adiutrix sp.]